MKFAALLPFLSLVAASPLRITIQDTEVTPNRNVFEEAGDVHGMLLQGYGVILEKC